MFFPCWSGNKFYLATVDDSLYRFVCPVYLHLLFFYSIWLWLFLCSKPDAPAPLATKIYYSQRNNRLRSALCHIYHESVASSKELCSSVVNSEFSNGSAYQSQTLTQKVMSSQQIYNLYNKPRSFMFSFPFLVLYYLFSLLVVYYFVLGIEHDENVVHIRALLKRLVNN